MAKRIQLVIIFSLFTFLLVACGGGEESASVDRDSTGSDANTEEAENSNGNQEDEYADLIAKFDQIGDVPVPENNPMTDKKVELGKILYFDPKLSGDNDRSCATCHLPALGWSDGLPLFNAIGDEEGARHSPSIINSGYYTSNFWDGRAESLEEQAKGPISSPVEMNQNLDELVDELKAVEGYPEMFEEAFGEEITVDNIAKAIAAFERTIVINDTRFNQFLDGDYDALTEQEIQGMELFAGKAQCITCHSGPNFSDNEFHNIGIEGDDKGRMDVTGDEADDGAFKTPTLYGIGHHPPYMHDGSLETLEEVIDYYDRGGDNHPNKSPLIQELNLTDEEKEALLAFLNVLTGENPEVEVPENIPGE